MAVAAEPAVSSQVPLHHSVVGGQPVEGLGGRRAVVSPATGQPFAECSLLSAEQAGAAVAGARAAFPAWSALSFEQRGTLMMALRATLVAEADDIAALVAREQGKPAA